MHDKKANHLARETSPYLLQHAYNPVDWYPWTEEALTRAREENKTILVSIGYSACHWCHVMERESFENETTAAYMNEHFINIKVDREERPDLDHIYMDAVQALSGSGGWPLNVFLTPDCRPFYGGTYFPPKAVMNRPSWMDILEAIVRTVRENPEDIQAQASNLTRHVMETNSHGREEAGTGDELFTTETTETIFQNLMRSADRQDGGFGRAPKFPQTFSIHYLLLHAHYSKNQAALDQAVLSLDKMMYGGIFDQIGGGFARYSTDTIWLAPHFEKMLYDNALLLMVYADAYQVTRFGRYRRLIMETVEFVKRELTDVTGMFYSALDADSEGEEGRFYVWSKSEIDEILGADARLFSAIYDVSEQGNWEGKNILRVIMKPEDYATQHGLEMQDVDQILYRCKQVLLERRNKRVRPGLDDKILLAWNALMISALCKASSATGDKTMMDMAIRACSQLEEKFRGETWYHTYKNGKAKYPAFLDDYANLIQAFIHLQEQTGDSTYLKKAEELTNLVIENFIDEDRVFFYYTHKNQKDVIIRKKEIYDGAVPAGNSIMAWNLLYLSVVFERADWKETVVKMLNSLGETTVKFPTSFGNWASLLHKMAYGVSELVVTGKGWREIHDQLLTIFMPHKVLQLSSVADDTFPLLQNKSFASEPVIYLCKNYSCHAPVNNVNSLIRLIEGDQSFS